MHCHHCTGATRGGQHAQELTVVQMQGIIGQEHLQAPHTRCNDLWHFVENDLIGCIRNDLMEGIIHHRLFRPAAILGQRLQDAVTFELGGKRNDACGSAGQRRRAAGNEVFFVGAAGRLQLLDMAMRIHAAGQHQQPLRIDRAFAAQVYADSGDAPGHDANIGHGTYRTP